MIWLFASGGQSIVTSASILPMSSQCWFPLGLTALIPLQFKGLKSLLQHYSSKTSIIWHSTFFIVQIPHPCMAIGKTVPWFLPANGCLWFHMLSGFVTAFPARNKCLLMFAVTMHSDFGRHENKNLSVSIVSWFICYQEVGLDDMLLIYWMSRFKSTF